MKILIAGAAGFVGSSIVSHIAAAHSGIELWGVDNLSRRGAELNVPRLRALGCRLRHGDLRCAADVDELPACDWIIDCAANASVLAGTRGGAAALVGHNLGGTLNLLEKCRRDGSGLVFLSTSRVYSVAALRRVPVVPAGLRYAVDGPCNATGLSGRGVTEEFSTAAPVSLYGATKLAGEVMTLEYADAYGFPVWVNRCGVIAGAGQLGNGEQGVFSWWIHARRAGRSLSFIGYDGRGLQVRDCLHPEDLARLVLMQIHAGADRTRPRMCNVAGGLDNSLSLAELNAWCDERYGPAVIGARPEARPYDVPWLVLDASLAQRHWGWRPEHPVGRVLDDIARHADEHPGWLDACA